MASKYAALTAYLTAEHEKTGRTEFGLTFGEISALVDGLPDAAKRRPQWWQNLKPLWAKGGWELQHVSMKNKHAIFALASTVSTSNLNSNLPSGKHRPLEFFLGLPPGQAQAALTFAEFSQIRGRDLTVKAQRSRVRWSNTNNKPWMQVGWKLQAVFMRSHLLVFRRIGTNLTDNITQYLQHVLEGKRLDGPRPTARELIEWLRLCQRLEWNFEGVTLYEKGGIDLGALDDGEQAELEQDYLLCKRRLAPAGGDHNQVRQYQAEDTAD